MERKIMKAVLREDYLAITGDYIEAMALNQFIYWTDKINKSDELLAVENEKARRSGCGETEPRNGWVYKSAKDLAKELMIGLSQPQMSRYIKSLVDKGYLVTRRNPKHKWDRTLQYKVDFSAVRSALNEKGYELSEYVELPENAVTTHNSSMNDDNSSMNNGRCVGEFAIPDITTDTTPKNYNKAFSEKKEDEYKASPHEDGVVERQVKKWCREHGQPYYEDVPDIINLFIRKYDEHFSEPHGNIPQKNIGKLYEAITDGIEDTLGYMVDDSVETYEGLIDCYFERDDYKDCDYRIYHFFSNDIRRIVYERSK